MLMEEDPLDAMRQHADELVKVARAHAMVATHYGKVVVYGDVPGPVVDAIVATLPHGHDAVVRDKLTDWPEAVQPIVGRWVGMLALPFDALGGGWFIRLRTEQVEEVVWGGRPDKLEQVGPMGTRLTPRGSFDAWTETVRGLACPWEAVVLANARLTLTEMLRVLNGRRTQTELSRTLLLAMLGHDLRDPLNSINMAGMVLEKTRNQPALGRRIQSSSSRMQRLIGQVLDMSRIDGGIALGAVRERFDLSALLDDLVDETSLANPHVVFQLQARSSIIVEGDSGRLAQVVSNLVSNARQHGELGRTVVIGLTVEQGEAVLEVCNAGAPIPDEFLPGLFNPFKRASLQNRRNRSGMGLGLYIAQQIVREHRGSIGYRHEGEQVIFAVRLPLAP